MTRVNMRRARTAAVVTGVAVGLFAGNAAFAYWTRSGSGTGTGTAGLGKTILSTAVDPTTGLLYPSSTYKGDLRATFTTTVAATLTSIKRDPSRLVSVNGVLGGNANCPGTVITLDDITGLSIPLAVGTSAPMVFTGKVSMSLSAPTGCQGASFSIPVILTGSES